MKAKFMEGSLIFEFFQQTQVFESPPARGSLASVINQIMTSQRYRRVEHVKTGFARSTIPKVETHFFAVHFHISVL